MNSSALKLVTGTCLSVLLAACGGDDSSTNAKDKKPTITTDNVDKVVNSIASPLLDTYSEISYVTNEALMLWTKTIESSISGVSMYDCSVSGKVDVTAAIITENKIDNNGSSIDFSFDKCRDQALGSSEASEYNGVLGLDFIKTNMFLEADNNPPMESEIKMSFDGFSFVDEGQYAYSINGEFIATENKSMTEDNLSSTKMLFSNDDGEIEVTNYNLSSEKTGKITNSNVAGVIFSKSLNTSYTVTTLSPLVNDEDADSLFSGGTVTFVAEPSVLSISFDKTGAAMMSLDSDGDGTFELTKKLFD